MILHVLCLGTRAMCIVMMMMIMDDDVVLFCWCWRGSDGRVKPVCGLMIVMAEVLLILLFVCAYVCVLILLY
jgi:hypothetical protein